MKRIVLLSTIYLLLSTPVFAQSVDILWQGNGYVPPFYEGKNLWAKQSLITFVAVPQGLGNSANLNYKWTRNGTVLGNISGVGRNTLSFKDAIFSKPYTVKVEIIGNDESVLAEASETIRAKNVSLLIYENNPLYGYMFHREVGNIFQLDKNEITFAAFPLFAGPGERGNAGFSYTWRAEGSPSSSGNSVTYRAPEGTEGISRISASFLESAKIIQPVERSFLIQFDDE